MRDIQNRTDLEDVLNDFYSAAFADPLLGPVFTDVAKLDLESHLPVITDFWESILFGTVRYQGNVMQKHIDLDQKGQLEPEHFNQWIELFQQAITTKFTGAKATEMLSRANVIAATMGYKLAALRGKN